MKNILKGIFAIASIALIGCTEDEQFIAMNDTNETYTGIMEVSESRTSLGDNGKVVWSNNDAISIFKRSGYHQKYQVVAGGSDIATFKYANASTSHGVSLTKNYAVYPYNSNHRIANNEIITLDLSSLATQNYTEGSFENGKSAMVAKSTNQELAFYNTLAMLRVKLCSEVPGDCSINLITLTSASKTLSGTATVDMSQDKQPAVFTSGNKTTTLTCTTPVKLENTCDGTTGGHDFYILVPVGNYPANDLTIKVTGVNTNDSSPIVYETAYPEALNLKRSGITTIHHKFEEGDWSAYIEPTQVSTAESAQAALDNATNGTTIQLAPNVNYGTLLFRKKTDKTNVDITDIGGDAPNNEWYSKYENITIIGAPGAVVDQIDFQVGWIGNSEGASYVDIKNLTVKGVTFSGQKTAFHIDGSKGGWLGIDGLTIDNCTMDDTDGTDRFVFQQISGYKQLNDKTTSTPVMTTGVKGLTINNCKVTGAYQVIESRAMENITITNNTFTGIKERDMLIASDATNHPSVTYTGAITITGNTSTGGKERFIRASLNNSNATITIKNNTITNYQGEDADWIKVDGATGTVTIENNTCSYTVATADNLKKALAAVTDGTTITLEAGTYEGLSFTDPANYKAKNITIVGKEGAEINGFSVNSWSAANNIEINGLTFKNITFTSGLLLSTKVMSNVTAQDCDFINDACIHQNDNTEKLTNLVVENCTFTGDKSGTTTALMLENTENVTVTGCTFTNIDFNVLQGGILTGTVLIDNNTINGTGDRVFRFVNTANVDITISNNWITSDGDADGELAKASAPTEITFTNNTWNGLTDTQVTGKLINITAK